MFTTIEKQGLDIDIFNMQMHRRKILFMKTSKTLPHFPKTWDFLIRIFFNSCDLISWDFIGSPHIILGNKDPEI